MEQPFRVKIFDQEYLIKSEEDEEEVLKVAEFVNKRFKEIKERTEGLSERKAAILAAFHIASEYFQLQKERDSRIADIQKRARVLNEQIDSLVR